MLNTATAWSANFTKKAILIKRPITAKEIFVGISSAISPRTDIVKHNGIAIIPAVVSPEPNNVSPAQFVELTPKYILSFKISYLHKTT